MTTIATECRVCPKGIVSCAHLGDRVVWLADPSRCVQHITTSLMRSMWNVLGPKVPERCECGVDHTTMPGPSFPADSLADAKAEFERRCALLRAEA